MPSFRVPPPRVTFPVAPRAALRRLVRPLALGLACAACVLAPPRAARAEDDAERKSANPDGPSLTVYSSADPAGFDPQRFMDQARAGNAPQFVGQVPGFGVVKEVRRIDLVPGENEVKFTDVAQFIDPTTVSFVDLTDGPQASVLEQSFRFDLASADKILDRYVGKSIGYETTFEGRSVSRIEGEVLSVGQGTVVLRTSEGLRFVGTRDAGLRLPSLPDGLLTKPTLVWRLVAPAAGPRRVRTTYQTAGLTWRADYNVVLDANDTTADVSAWVTLLNMSGASFRDTRLKLVAGDVQRVTPAKPSGPTLRAGAARKSLASEAFEEKSFFEYHLYTLPRRTDVLETATQQITLFPAARGVAVEKVFVYYGLPSGGQWFFASPRTDRELGNDSNKKVDVYVQWKNAKENRMGMPLPKGKVRVYKQDDADGTLEFVGEDLIDHTPRDERVRVKLGQAFDVVGERTQVRFDVDANGHRMTEAFRIELRNHKAEPVRVIVRENLYRWVNWEIAASSHPFEKQDARTIHFPVDVPPDGTQVVEYEVVYTW